MSTAKKSEFVISFRVSHEERDKLYEQAKDSGMSISSLIRNYLFLLEKYESGNLRLAK